MLPLDFYENLDPDYYHELNHALDNADHYKEATHGDDVPYFYWPEEDYLIPESWIEDVSSDVYFEPSN